MQVDTLVCYILIIYFIYSIYNFSFCANFSLCDISIVIPSTFSTFNYCKGRLFKMIEEQYMKPYEVIIVISNCIKTWRIKYKRNGIIYILFCKIGRHNQAENRNTGIKLSKCKYISLFDSDDYMSKARIQLILYTFNHNPKIDFILHSYTFIKSSLYNNNEKKEIFLDYTYNYSFEDIFRSYNKNRNSPLHLKYCCKFLNITNIQNAWLSGKASMLKSNLYKEGMKYYRIEDTELNTRLIIRKYNLILIKYNLGIYMPRSNCKS